MDIEFKQKFTKEVLDGIINKLERDGVTIYKDLLEKGLDDLCSTRRWFSDDFSYGVISDDICGVCDERVDYIFSGEDYVCTDDENLEDVKRYLKWNKEALVSVFDAHLFHQITKAVHEVLDKLDSEIIPQDDCPFTDIVIIDRVEKPSAFISYMKTCRSLLYRYTFGWYQ